ncbi:unnamed protein product, partial [Staurois parvus]
YSGTQNCYSHRHRIVTEGHRTVTWGHRNVNQGHRELLLRATELLLRATELLLAQTQNCYSGTQNCYSGTHNRLIKEYVRQHAEEWQRRQCFRSERADVAAEEGVEGSTIRSQRTRVLPVSSQRSVSPPTTLPVVDWLLRSSSSSQVTSDTYSQRSVGTSDTTVSWHGPGTKPTEITCPLPAPVLWCSLTKRSIACCGLSPLYSEEELTVGGQERGETSAFSAARRRSSWRGEWLGSRSRDRSVS